MGGRNSGKPANKALLRNVARLRAKGLTYQQIAEQFGVTRQWAQQVYDSLIYPEKYPRRKVRLTITVILRWADAFYKRTGQWPRVHSGAVPESPSDTWTGLDAALRQGCRGLPGGSSLYQVLRRRRGIARRQGG